MAMLNMSRGPLWLSSGLLIMIAGCGGQGFVSPNFLKITVTPSTLDIGDTAALHAIAHRSDGSTQDVTAGAQWSISDSSLATLNSGTISAKAAGSVTIQAEYGDIPPASPAAIPSSGNLNSSAKVSISSATTKKIKPTITWAEPSAIRYPRAISSVQLNAQASVPGTFAYIPAAGTVLNAGSQTLGAIFTPNNTSAYAVAYKVIPFQVDQIVPTIDWPAPASIAQGTALSAKQLNATSNVFGTFTYDPGVGTVLPAGTHNLSVSFSTKDTTDYAMVTSSNSITIRGAVLPPPSSCGGPTVNLDSSMSTGDIQNAIAGAPDCSLILFAAGTYNINAPIIISCPSTGLIISGPTVDWPGPYKVTINGSVAGGWGFRFGPCASAVTIEYLNWNGGEPSEGGGGFLYVASATSNLTVQYNFIYGNQANVDTGHQFDSLIWMDGSETDPASNYSYNDTINWNIFGNSNDGTWTNADCGAISQLFDYQGSSYDSVGGYCAALGVRASTTNLTFNNNIVHYQEQGVKMHEGGATANTFFYQTNFSFMYNDMSYIHRIVLENQQTPTPANYLYNDVHDQVWPAWGSWVFSLASAPTNNCNNNIDIANLLAPGGPNTGPGFVEFWGNGNCNNNLVQGYQGASMQWGYGGPGDVSYNILQNLAGGGFVNNEELLNPSYGPSMNGNIEVRSLSTVQSAAPTISPAATRPYSSPINVTLTDNGFTSNGIGPQGNTTIYYTTDGSTPTTSSTPCNTTPGSSSCTISVSPGTTVKAIGMWGALNQPRSYPSGYGFVPSAVVAASYLAAAVKGPATPSATTTEALRTANLATAVVLESVSILPSQPVVAIGSSTQLKAIAAFNDGSSKDITADFNWKSSDMRTIAVTSAGLLSGVADGPAQISGSYLGQQASVPALGSVGEVRWSAPIVITQGGAYSGNWQSKDPSTPAVTIATLDPVLIQDSHMSSQSDLIQVSVKGANVTVRNSLGLALSGPVKGQPNGAFLVVSSPARLDVENNYMENVREGVAVHGYSGSLNEPQTLVIRGNRARNLNGLLSDGSGGYLPGQGANRRLSRFVALDNVQAVPGVEVGWNEVVDYPAKSLVSDVINLYRSSGTPNHPLEVHDTYIEGVYPYRPALDAYLGGGIKTDGAADDTTQNASAFAFIHDNQVVGTVTYGIAFNAGHDNLAANNRVISSGLLADGTKIAAQQVGLSNVNMHGGTQYNNTMRDNLVGWACWSSSCAGAQFLPASPGDYSSNTVLSADQITPDAVEKEYLLWLSKTASAGIRVGPTF